MDSRRREIARSPRGWILHCSEESPDFTFSVLCGTVGLYEVQIALSFDERGAYMIAGDAYLDGLAEQIRAHPQRYEARSIAG